MVIFALTREGYKELEPLIKDSNSSVWVNCGILSAEELGELRRSGLDITNFTHYIDKNNEEQMREAIEEIKEHHPGQRIWVEL